jgi:hypothetical protein
MRDFFRHYVIHNIGLKTLSLFLSIVLWLAISTGRLH